MTGIVAFRAETLLVLGALLLAAGILTPGWSLAVVACIATGGILVGLSFAARPRC